MNMTVLATLCQIASTAPCVDEIITDQAGFAECMFKAQIGISDWMSHHPTYHAGWRLDRFKCVQWKHEKERGI